MGRTGAAAVVAVTVMLCAASCGDDSGSGGSSSTAGGTTVTSSTTGATGATTTTGATTSSTTQSSTSTGSGAFELTSSVLMEGGTIPEEHECTSGGGQNVSPPLSWTAGPAGTMSYAIVMRDLDFMSGFIHWVIWDIPSDVTSLPAGVEGVYQPSVPAGAKQAPFNAGTIGYFGPCSPNSVNTYEFTVYAVGTATIPGLDDQSTKQEAEAAIVGAAIGSATLSGES